MSEKVKGKKAQAPKVSLYEKMLLRKKAAKIRKAERRGRPGPQESDLGQSWHSE